MLGAQKAGRMKNAAHHPSSCLEPAVWSTGRFKSLEIPGTLLVLHEGFQIPALGSTSSLLMASGIFDSRARKHLRGPEEPISMKHL